MNENTRPSKLSIASFVLAILPFVAILGVPANILFFISLGAVPIAALVLSACAVFRIARSSGMLTGYIRVCVAILFAVIQLGVIRPWLVQSHEALNKAVCRGHANTHIELFKSMWAQDHDPTNGQVITWQDLTPYTKGKQFSCPSGGTYKLNPIGTYTECSIPEHKKHAQDHAKWRQSSEARGQDGKGERRILTQ